MRNSCFLTLRFWEAAKTVLGPDVFGPVPSPDRGFQTPRNLLLVVDSGHLIPELMYLFSLLDPRKLFARASSIQAILKGNPPNTKGHAPCGGFKGEVLEVAFAEAAISQLPQFGCRRLPHRLPLHPSGETWFGTSTSVLSNRRRLKLRLWELLNIMLTQD